MVVGLPVGLLAAGLATSCHRASTGGGGVPDAVEVTRVVDGDTIAITRDGAEVRVRLIGIDTPETKKPNAPVECFGKEASARTEDLLPPGTAVRLVYDAERLDRYGRDLAYVYRQSDGLFVNLSLVTDGFANVDTIAPNTAHAGELNQAARRARQQRTGLWQACSSAHQPAST